MVIIGEKINEHRGLVCRVFNLRNLRQLSNDAEVNGIICHVAHSLISVKKINMYHNY